MVMTIYISYLTCNCFLGGTTYRGFPHQTFFRSSEIRYIRVAITVEGKFWLLAVFYSIFGHVDCVKMLLKQGANPAAETGEFIDLHVVAIIQLMRLTINMILS